MSVTFNKICMPEKLMLNYNPFKVDDASANTEENAFRWKPIEVEMM